MAKRNPKRVIISEAILRDLQQGGNDAGLLLGVALAERLRAAPESAKPKLSRRGLDVFAADSTRK